jgi:hypothetical protein
MNINAVKLHQVLGLPKKLLAWVAVFLLFSAGLSASYSGQLEAIWWMPLQRNYDFAIIPGTNTETFKALASPHLGGRIQGRYDRDCLFAQLSYLYLRTTDTAEINRANANILMPQLPVGLNRVRAQLKHRYQNVDLRVGRYLLKECENTFYLFSNARWVDINYRESTTGASPAFQVNFLQKANFEGGGLGVGFGGSYGLFGGLSCFGEFGPMAVIGRQTAPIQRATINGGVSFFNMTDQTCVIPATDFLFGLRYRYDCSCLSILAQVGYEINYYWDALKYIPFSGGVTLAGPPSRCFHEGFAGPSASLKVIF